MSAKDLGEAAQGLSEVVGDVRGYLDDREREDRRREDRALGPDLPRVGLLPGLRDPTADYDKLGRKQPRTMSIAFFALRLPGMADRIRRVPARAVVEEREEEALIDCPCGGHPVAPVHQWEKCPGCDRQYAYPGGVVLVLYGDMEIPTR